MSSLINPVTLPAPPHRVMYISSPNEDDIRIIYDGPLLAGTNDPVIKEPVVARHKSDTQTDGSVGFLEFTTLEDYKSALAAVKHIRKPQRCTIGLLTPDKVHLCRSYETSVGQRHSSRPNSPVPVESVKAEPIDEAEMAPMEWDQIDRAEQDEERVEEDESGMDIDQDESVEHSATTDNSAMDEESAEADSTEGKSTKEGYGHVEGGLTTDDEGSEAADFGRMEEELMGMEALMDMNAGEFVEGNPEDEYRLEEDEHDDEHHAHGESVEDDDDDSRDEDDWETIEDDEHVAAQAVMQRALHSFSPSEDGDQRDEDEGLKEEDGDERVEHDEDGNEELAVFNARSSSAVSASSGPSGRKRTFNQVDAGSDDEDTTIRRLKKMVRYAAGKVEERGREVLAVELGARKAAATYEEEISKAGSLKTQVEEYAAATIARVTMFGELDRQSYIDEKAAKHDPEVMRVLAVIDSV